MIQSSNKKRIFSQKTENAFLEMIFYAERCEPKYRLKKGPLLFEIKNTHKMTDEKAREIFLEAWGKINWSSKESIRPFLVYVERAWELTKRTTYSSHSTLEAALRSDSHLIRMVVPDEPVNGKPQKAVAKIREIVRSGTLIKVEATDCLVTSTSLLAKRSQI